MEKVVIFGNGTVARTVYLTLTHDSPYEVVAFTVDPDHLDEPYLFERPVIPFPEVAAHYPPDVYGMFIAVGYIQVNRVRAERYCQAKEMGYRLISHVSSRAIVAPDLEIGENCWIGVNSVVGPFTAIGNDTMIGTGSFIGHHVTIGEHCYIGDSVSLAGGVTVGPYCFLGVGAIVRNKIALARECVIGAGALILQDTGEREVYMGQAADLLPIASDKLSLT